MISGTSSSQKLTTWFHASSTSTKPAANVARRAYEKRASSASKASQVARRDASLVRYSSGAEADTRSALSRVSSGDVVVDELSERRRKLLVRAAQSSEVLAVDEHGTVRCFTRAGQA